MNARRKILVAATVLVVAYVGVMLIRTDETERTPVPLTPTSSRVDLSGVVLQGVEGTTTTTVPPNVGKVVLSGFVRTPEGLAVPGAVVRAEWWRVDPPQVIELLTNEFGQWEIRDVAAGRWKIRAYRAPDFATGKVEQVFLEEDAQKEFSLEVREVEEFSVTWDVEPDPPITGTTTSLAVQYAERTVDAEGRTVTTPLTAVTVTLLADSDWDLVTGTPSQTTDGNGGVNWVLRCTADGPQSLAVSSVYGTTNLAVAACIPITSTSTTSTLPPPPPPSETTTTTRPPGGGGGGGNRIEG